MTYQIKMTKGTTTAFYHCGRPVLQSQGLKFRRKSDALACIARNPVDGWSLTAVRG